MGDFWKLYDELIDGMDPSVITDKVICGQTWTAVISENDGFGMAMTTSGDSRPRSQIDYQGLPLKKVAELVKSWNFLEASIGMAAINAYYNTAGRMYENGWKQPDRRFCTFDVDMKDRKVVMIGHLRFDEDVFDGVRQLQILEMNPRQGDYPASACEVLVPDCDVVIITGAAFINKTMPRLLELAENAFTIITGPSVPMAEVLVRNNSIQRVAGFIPTEHHTLWRYISAGCITSPYEYGERFFIDQK